MTKQHYGLSWLPTYGEGQKMLLRDTIYRKLRQAILSCEFSPGQELREAELADLEG